MHSNWVRATPQSRQGPLSSVMAMRLVTFGHTTLQAAILPVEEQPALLNAFFALVRVQAGQWTRNEQQWTTAFYCFTYKFYIF